MPSSSATSSWSSATGAGRSRSWCTPSRAPCPSRSSAPAQDDQALIFSPDDRRRLLELPLDGLQLHRRDDRLGALGGHPRVHDDGAGPALVAAAGLDACSRSSTASSTRPSCSLVLVAVLRAGPVARRTSRRPSSFMLLGSLSRHRHRHDGRGPAAPLRRAGRPDDVRAPVAAAAHQRRLLPRRRPARRGCRRCPSCRRPRTSSTASARRSSTAPPIADLWGDIVWPLVDHGASCSSRSGIWAFGRAERYAKRTGKLKRVG